MRRFMPKTLPISCLLLAALAIPGASAQEPDSVASWAFIESVGGMALGQPQPVTEGSGWILPIHCDLTGLRKISTQPTALNSSQVIKELRWTVKDNRLLVQLLLKSSVYATGEARCPSIKLKLPAGRELEVVYQDGDQQIPIGTTKLTAK